MKPWKKLREETVLADLQYRAIMKRTYRLGDGREHTYEILLQNDTACVLAFTPDQKVILSQQFRPGTEEICRELPGGFIEKGESPKKAIVRELLEETGYVGDIEYVGCCPDGAFSTTKRHCFIARNCTKTKNPHFDDGEEIEIVVCSLEEFKQIVRSGKMTTVAESYLALDYLKLL